MALKSLLKVEFTLARELGVDPYLINFMDFKEVEYLNDELAKYLAGKNG